MSIKSNIAAVFIIFMSILFIQGCDDKKNEGSNSKGSDTVNADLITKDDKGTKVSLLLKPKVGDVLKYKMNAKTTSKENSPLTEGKELTSIQDINYYYSEEVTDITSAGIVSYKITFDSITIISNLASGDSSVSLTYNSNIKDSIYSKPDFLQYNAIMAEDFYARVGQNGEISDIYGLEKVYEKMFKALGDTLSNEQKESLKDSFGRDAIKAVLQQQFQMFPESAVYLDSVWTRSYETQMLIFPVRNSLSYKLNEVKEENNQTILTIDADLAVDFIEKEIKDKQMSYKVENSETGGKGLIVYNLTKGCVVKKETSTNLKLDMKISAGSQSVNTTQDVTTELFVNLIQ
ncbi:MAG TPA: DUF6263 family protein [Ignavibacteria bacterium]|nr:DUF6263 family protein [Ignavibacteria bacterium]HQY51742.1 DUF6263 family protein [Ignavibacteria bacterium]HRA99395.1 DUF6263 family protein [Ignavibacteria bacterium]